MVFPHSEFDPEAATPTAPHTDSPRPMAPVTDRAMAFFIDVTIVVPVLQLLVAPLTKQIQFLSIAMPESSEASALFLITSAIYATLILFYQTVGIAFWGATPGKLFLKLRVQSVNGHRPTFGQSLVRSFLWELETLFFCIPFLEIFGHPQRRLLHDRASETIVVTLKAKAELPPQPIETKLVRNFLTAGTVLGFLWAFLFLVRLYDHAEKADFKKQDMVASHQLCEDVTSDSNNRVDEALSLFLIGEISPDCLKKESDFALWTLHQKQRDWGLLAKSFLNIDDRETVQAYRKEICKSPDSETCKIAGLLEKEGHEQKDKAETFTAFHSLTAKVLRLEAFEKNGQFEELDHELAGEFPPRLRQSLVGYKSRSLWSQYKFDQARGLIDSIALTQSTFNQSKWLGWACLAEIQQDCEKAALQSSCQTISSDTFHEKIEDIASDTILAKIHLSECTDHHAPLNLVEREYLLKNDNLRTLVETELGESPSEKKANDLAHLFRSSSGLFQERVLESWTQNAIKSLATQPLLSELQEFTRHDHIWETSVLHVFRQAYQMHDVKSELRVLQILPESSFVRAGLQKELLVSAVDNDDLKLAKNLERKYFAGHPSAAGSRPNPRDPASAPEPRGPASAPEKFGPNSAKNEKSGSDDSRWTEALKKLKEKSP